MPKRSSIASTNPVACSACGHKPLETHHIFIRAFYLALFGAAFFIPFCDTVGGRLALWGAGFLTALSWAWVQRQEAHR